jgi:2-isopropylmalate synthase
VRNPPISTLPFHAARTRHQVRTLPPVDLPGANGPNRTLTRAPIWCSVDLRDGNQALAQPMSVEEKLEFFEMLVRIGFKEIEVGFPSASQIEFDFTRRLIEENRIPDDVAIQVLCQCREDLITRTLESVRGAKNVIFHLYNSTSPKQREYVFNLPKARDRAPSPCAVEQLKRDSRALVAAGTRLRLEYSPESFTSTELDFALEICEAVTDVWGPTPRTRSSSTCRRPSSTRRPTSTPTRSSGCAPT